MNIKMCVHCECVNNIGNYSCINCGVKYFIKFKTKEEVKEYLNAKYGKNSVSSIDYDSKYPEKEKHYVDTDSVEKEWYYNAGDVECIDGIKSAIGQLKGTEAFYSGNIIKYMWRWKHKNGVEDLKKAKTYLEWLIEEVDKEG